MACYGHCNDNRQTYVKVYVGDEEDYSGLDGGLDDSDNDVTLCGDAKYGYVTAANGVI